MKEQLMKLANKPLEVVNKILDQISDPKKLILYAAAAIVIIDVYRGGELGAVNYGLDTAKGAIALVSNELSKNGTIIAILVSLYLIFNKK